MMVNINKRNDTVDRSTIRCTDTDKSKILLRFRDLQISRTGSEHRVTLILGPKNGVMEYDVVNGELFRCVFETRKEPIKRPLL